MVGSSRASVRSSSAPASLEKPTTSAARIAASFRVSLIAPVSRGADLARRRDARSRVQLTEGNPRPSPTGRFGSNPAVHGAGTKRVFYPLASANPVSVSNFFAYVEDRFVREYAGQRAPVST